MDQLKFLLYILSRTGLMITVIVVGAFLGGIFIPAVLTFLPSSLMNIKTFFLDNTIQSVICLSVASVFLMVLFYSDGKKQSAYENWSAVNIVIVFLLMEFVYFIPTVFRDSFTTEGKAEIFYKVLYFPCSWLYDGMNVNFYVSVLTTSGILILLSFIMYVTAYIIYRKKHPDIYKSFPDTNSGD